MLMAITYSVDEVVDLVQFAANLGFLGGVIFSLITAVFMFYMYRLSLMKNFKMYLAEIDHNDAKDVTDAFNDVVEEVKALADKTNLKLFKFGYNQLLHVENYIKRRWMQN